MLSAIFSLGGRAKKRGSRPPRRQHLGERRRGRSGRRKPIRLAGRRDLVGHPRVAWTARREQSGHVEIGSCRPISCQSSSRDGAGRARWRGACGAAPVLGAEAGGGLGPAGGRPARPLITAGRAFSSSNQPLEYLTRPGRCPAKFQVRPRQQICRRSCYRTRPIGTALSRLLSTPYIRWTSSAKRAWRRTGRPRSRARAEVGASPVFGALVCIARSPLVTSYWRGRRSAARAALLLRRVHHDRAALETETGSPPPSVRATTGRHPVVGADLQEVFGELVAAAVVGVGRLVGTPSSSSRMSLLAVGCGQ